MDEELKNKSQAVEKKSEGLDIVSEKKDLNSLKNDIIDKKLNTLEIPQSTRDILDLLKNKPDGSKTNMYKKLEKLEGVDFNIEKIANNIDKTVKKYLYQSLLDRKGNIKVDDNVINSMSVGIQFAMMETITDIGGDKGSDFFDSFSNLKTENSGKLLNGLMDVFGSGKGLLGKAGNINKFYVLANRFQNCVSYISMHSGIRKENEIGDGMKIVELVNGNKFRKILNNEIWDTNEGLISKKLSDVGFTTSEEIKPSILQEDKIELQNIADNIDMPIDLKTIKSIEKAIPVVQDLLGKRSSYKDNISGLVDKIGGILDINLLGFGTLGSLLGIKSPTDFLRSKKGEKKGILDFILTGMGFQGGVEGLHREYVRKNIDENLDSDEKKDFISDLFIYYNKEQKSNPEYNGQKTIDKFGLSKIDEGTKNKIPNKYDILKKSFGEKLKGKEKLINPNILMKYGLKDGLKDEKFTDKDGKEKTRLVIDETKFDSSKIDEKFIDNYLEGNIKTLIADENFMKDIEGSDQFVLALMGNLVAGSWFIEGVVIGEEVIEGYLVNDKQIGTQEEKDEKKVYLGDREILEKIDIELKKYNSLIKPEDVLGSSKQYNVPVEYIMAFMKNDSTYATAGKGERTNNPGNIGNDDLGNEKEYNNLKDGVYALGKHLKLRIDEYQKVYGIVVLPSAKELADNIGPDGNGFLSNQENYKKPNPERKGAYMTAKSGGFNVNNFTNDLAGLGISNYKQAA